MNTLISIFPSGHLPERRVLPRTPALAPDRQAAWKPLAAVERFLSWRRSLGPASLGSSATRSACGLEGHHRVDAYLQGLGYVA